MPLHKLLVYITLCCVTSTPVDPRLTPRMAGTRCLTSHELVHGQHSTAPVQVTHVPTCMGRLCHSQRCVPGCYNQRSSPVKGLVQRAVMKQSINLSARPASPLYPPKRWARGVQACKALPSPGLPQIPPMKAFGKAHPALHRAQMDSRAGAGVASRHAARANVHSPETALVPHACWHSCRAQCMHCSATVHSPPSPHSACAPASYGPAQQPAFQPARAPRGGLSSPILCTRLLLLLPEPPPSSL